LDQQRIFGIVQSYIRREVQSEYAAIYRLEKGELVPVPVDQVETRSRRRSLSEVLDVAIHSAQAGAVITDAKEGYRWIERAPMSPGLFLFRFRSVGDSEFVCVCLAPEKPKTLDAFDSRMALLRAQLEVSGKNIEKYLGVQHLVFVDDATGLYNTRYLYNILEREAAAHQATGRSFAILFMDGDRFKGINDTYGHLAGTKLLYELGAQLKSFVRGRDTVFRYGGDEFVAVLSNCDLQTAKQVAERIRAKVEKYVFLKDEQKNIHITVSIGVALFPDHAGTIKEVIEAADHAMYAAKRHTRNSVFIAEIPSSDPEKIQTRSE
jgi:diguanylate cyclase (GGDEF)-like protein